MEHNALLSADEGQKLEERLASDAGDGEGLFILRSGFSKKYVAWHLIPAMGIVVARTASFDAIRTQMYILELFVAFAILAAVVILFLIIRGTSTRLLAGVYTLISGMRKVGGGDYGTRLPEDGQDELGEAMRSFNKMVVQLADQMELIKHEEHLIAETEMKAMQNQINAHFLYNILETIKMQAVIANEDDIAESLTELGKLMHYSLRWKVHVVSLSQEVDYIRSYIALLNLRNDYVISLKNEIPDAYGNIQIPKMILQPLVENSFSHGIEPKGEDAEIRVFSEPDPGHGDRLFLCVQDFGDGIPEAELGRIEEYLSSDSYEREGGGNIGLKNIQQRLVILYGKDFRIRIDSCAGKGTCVRIPVRKEM